MTRAVTVPLVLAVLTALVAFVVASGVSPGEERKTRPPVGEVRIEKVLDVQLPEV